MPDPSKMLDELERLSRVATVGPWRCDDGNVFSGPIADAEYAERSKRRLAGLPNGPRNGNSAFITGGQQNDNHDANSEFICAARNAVLALIEVARAAARVHSESTVYDRDSFRALKALGDALSKLGQPAGKERAE